MGAELEKKNEVILEIKDLKKYYPLPKKSPFSEQKYFRAVDGVSLKVRKGRTLGIVGESGCGKTTIARMVVRLLEPTSGEILFKGENLLDFRGSRLHRMRKEIQFVFQDPYASLNPKMKCYDILKEPLIVHGFADHISAREKVEKLLALVGLPKEAADKYPHEFSGGQRQRIGIARALTVNPELIICDEPVSALDVSIQSQILNLLRQLQQKFDLTYIFIAHGLNVVKHISDDVAVMYLGRIMETASSDEIFENPVHPYTNALMAAIPMPDPNKPMPQSVLEGEATKSAADTDGCSFFPRCPMAKEICRTKLPEMTEVCEGHCVRCHFALELYNGKKGTK